MDSIINATNPTMTPWPEKNTLMVELTGMYYHDTLTPSQYHSQYAVSLLLTTHPRDTLMVELTGIITPDTLTMPLITNNPHFTHPFNATNYANTPDILTGPSVTSVLEQLEIVKGVSLTNRGYVRYKFILTHTLLIHPIPHHTVSTHTFNWRS